MTNEPQDDGYLLDQPPSPPPRYICIYGDASAANRRNVEEWAVYQAQLALWLDAQRRL